MRTVLVKAHVGWGHLFGVILIGHYPWTPPPEEIHVVIKGMHTAR